MKKSLDQRFVRCREDTNTNEKKFHLDEFAMLLGNGMNARREEGGQVRYTIVSLEHLSKHVN